MSSGVQSKKLSKKTVELITTEYSALQTEAQKIAVEMRHVLKRGLTQDVNLSPAHRAALLQEAELFDLTVATVSNLAKSPHVQLVFGIEDALHAYLSKDPTSLPVVLRDFLKGSITLPTAAVS